MISKEEDKKLQKQLNFLVQSVSCTEFYTFPSINLFYSLPLGGGMMLDLRLLHQGLQDKLKQTC